jgi:hypothetical protein
MLFIPASLVNGLAEYGHGISPTLSVETMESILDSTNFSYCQLLTDAILTRYRIQYPNLPLYTYTAKGANQSTLSPAAVTQYYAASGLDVDVVKSLSTLNCVVTTDDVLLVFEGDDSERRPFTERVIISMAETKSIDDVMSSDVWQYCCKTF